jgi:hypothetical protein
MRLGRVTFLVRVIEYSGYGYGRSATTHSSFVVCLPFNPYLELLHSAGIAAAVSDRDERLNLCTLAPAPYGLFAV